MSKKEQADLVLPSLEEFLLAGFTPAQIRAKIGDNPELRAAIIAAYETFKTAIPPGDLAFTFQLAKLADLYSRCHESRDYSTCLAIVKEQDKLIVARMKNEDTKKDGWY